MRRPWGSLAVWTAGSGPVVVAVHGLGGSGRYWEGLARRLGRTHAVVAPDLAGFGRSDKPHLRYDRDFQRANLDAVVAAVAGSRRVALAGHSVGAVLAALWAAHNPGRVAALALVAAPFPGLHAMPPPARWIRDRPPSWRRRAAGAVIRVAWPVVTLPLTLSRSYPRAVVRDFARQSVQARAWTMWSLMADGEAAGELAGLRDLPAGVPTLLLNAADDRWVSPEDVRRWRELLPAAESAEAPGGHQLLLRGSGFAELAGWLGDATPRADA